MEKLNDKWLRITGMAVQNLIFFLFFYLRQVLEGHQPVWKVIGWQVLFVLVIWESIRLTIRLARTRYPELDQIRRRTLMLGGMLVVTSVIVGSWHVLTENWLGLYPQGEVNVFSYLYSIGMTLFFSQLIAGVYESIYYLRQWKTSVKEAEELKKANLQSQLDSLKNQVNPHFLFNSLNSLSALVEEDPKRAVRFIEELSNIYRYLLQSNEKELIPLSRELEFIDAYSFLLQTRFEDGLILSVEVEPHLMDCLLPPLTLQILVENAVKHNMVSAATPLTIRIYNDAAGNLTVVNTLRKRKITVPSHKMGLVNVAAKYRLLNQPELVIDQSETHFQVVVPLIRKAQHEYSHH
jgi:LytS/YehU family sensor histidine kinase